MCAPHSRRKVLVRWEIELSSPRMQIISLPFNLVVQSMMVDDLRQSGAYGSERVLNGFSVFDFMMIHSVLRSRHHKALHSLPRSLVRHIKTIQSSAYFSCLLRMSYYGWSCLPGRRLSGRSLPQIWHYVCEQGFWKERERRRESCNLWGF